MSIDFIQTEGYVQLILKSSLILKIIMVTCYTNMCSRFVFDVFTQVVLLLSLYYMCTQAESPKEECHYTYTETSGHINSPYYPRRYGDDMYCTYLIRGPVGSRVSVKFSTFALERKNKGRCEYDWIEIHDGTDISAHSLIGERRFCADDLCGSFLTSKTNHMLIVFNTDARDNLKGFRLRYSINTTFPQALGLEERTIADQDIKASSELLSYPAANARLHTPNSSWCYRVQSIDDYLQVDFNDYFIVSEIETQGYQMGRHKNTSYYAKNYTLRFSYDSKTWYPYQNNSAITKVFKGNNDGTCVVENVLQRETMAKLMRIYPKAIPGNKLICMRLEVLGRWGVLVPRLTVKVQSIDNLRKHAKIECDVEAQAGVQLKWKFNKLPGYKQWVTSHNRARGIFYEEQSTIQLSAETENFAENHNCFRSVKRKQILCKITVMCLVKYGFDNKLFNSKSVDIEFIWNNSDPKILKSRGTEGSSQEKQSFLSKPHVAYSLIGLVGLCFVAIIILLTKNSRKNRRNVLIQRSLNLTDHEEVELTTQTENPVPNSAEGCSNRKTGRPDHAYMPLIPQKREVEPYQPLQQNPLHTRSCQNNANRKMYENVPIPQGQ